MTEVVESGPEGVYAQEPDPENTTDIHTSEPPPRVIVIGKPPDSPK